MSRAIYLLLLGRLDDAGAQCEGASKLYDHDWTDQVRAALAFAHLDMSGVRRNLERMKTVGSIPYRSKGYLLDACLCAEQNRWDQAEGLLLHGVALDRENSVPREAQLANRRALAAVYIHQGRRGDAVVLCRKILDEKPGWRAVLEAGALMARAGDIRAAQQCLPPGLPKDPPAAPPALLPSGVRSEFMQWPRYWRRVLDLWSEIALYRGDWKRAFALLRNAPQTDASQEWQSNLFRAAVLSGERDTARQMLRSLLSNPASYWLVADTSGPGFLREALAQAETFKDSLGNWASWKRFLEQSN
jgi:tetratricopeptide (TPR) repeat protein